jgi:hypothetical protein
MGRFLSTFSIKCPWFYEYQFEKPRDTVTYPEFRITTPQHLYRDLEGLLAAFPDNEYQTIVGNPERLPWRELPLERLPCRELPLE